MEITIKSVQPRIGEMIGDENVIVCGISALECLALFSGYLDAHTVDVYALAEGTNAALRYHVVDTFAGIGTVSCGSFRCTSVSQTLNDLLSDYNNVGDAVLSEALANYYHAHAQSFDGLEIAEENKPLFDKLRQ